MKTIILNKDLLYDLYAENEYLIISNKDYLKNNGRNGSKLNLEVQFTIDILKTRFRSLLKQIGDDKDVIVELKFRFIYEFNTENNSFKLEKDDTQYYIKGNYILQNKELLSEIKDKFIETHTDIINRIGDNKLFKIIDVNTNNSKSYEEKLSEILKVEKEAIKICEKIKAPIYKININEYIDEDYDIYYDEINSLIREITELSDSTNSTKIEFHLSSNEEILTFIVTEKNHLYYYDIGNDENYNTEDVFDYINRDIKDNFTGFELQLKIKPQNNFVDDKILTYINSRYEEVVSNKETYLEELKTIVNEITTALNETYDKLKDLIKERL